MTIVAALESAVSVECLSVIDPSWLERLGDRDAHAAIAADLAWLHDIEVVPPPQPVELGGWIRVAAWNVERGRRVEELAAVVAATGAQVVLVSEADAGMVRSGNRDVAADLGALLAMGSAFGVEYVELGLGDAREAAAIAAAGDGENRRSLHGNAVLSSAALAEARAVRIELAGNWYSAEVGEPRIGGRMAVAAEVLVDGVTVTVASVHLESSSDAGDRADQLEVVLAAVGDDGPAIVGGDLNTFGATFAEIGDHRELRRMRAAEPTRFSWPIAQEPAFEVAARHGFSWVDSNLAAPTTNHRADGTPHHHPLHLDWLLVRGFEARRPTIVPAVAPDGTVLSDHELIAVSLRLQR